MSSNPPWDEEYPYLDNTKADIRLLGVPNIFTPFGHFNSASRVQMLGHHLPQSMVLDKPEFNRVFSGIESHLNDYTFNHSKRRFDCEVIAVIPKYSRKIMHLDQCPEIYVIVLTYEPDGKRRLDYFTVNRYFKGAQGFGFLPEYVAGTIQKGDVISKETLITKSPSQVGNESRYGTNLNVIYGSFPDTIEDAFTISESAAKKLQAVQIHQKVINCRQDRRPLYLNGNEKVGKFLPDIGEYIRPDGAICAFRPVHWTTCLADTDPEALRETMPMQDETIYAEEPGGRIIDLTFNINRGRMNDCYDQALRYNVDNLTCWQSIYMTYLEHVKKNPKYALTRKMSTLVTDSIYHMIAQGGRVESLENDPFFRKAMRKFDLVGGNNQIIDFMQVIITYTSPRFAVKGSKITDLAGGKN